MPDELTVVGFDDLPVASWPVFDLTTVSNPVKDSAAQAARLLVRRITSGPEAPYEHQVARHRPRAAQHPRTTAVGDLSPTDSRS